MKKTLIALLVVLAIGSVYLVLSKDNRSEKNTPLGPKIVRLYKSPTCGCCDGYAKYLKWNGYEVEVRNVADMSVIKKKYNVPSNLFSCHTVDFGDYVVEGHIPIEAIDKLLTEKPDIKGIGMPGMPAGSPGMGGSKKGPFNVYTIEKDGSIQEFVSI